MEHHHRRLERGHGMVDVAGVDDGDGSVSIFVVVGSGERRTVVYTWKFERAEAEVEESLLGCRTNVCCLRWK